MSVRPSSDLIGLDSLLIEIASLTLFALGGGIPGLVKAARIRRFKGKLKLNRASLAPQQDIIDHGLIRHTGSHYQHRHLLNFGPDFVTLLHRIQPLRVAAGLLIVLVLLGSLDFATRATVRKFSELAQGDILKPIPVSGTQTEAVPLPTRKPQVVYKSPKKKAANATIQKKLAQRKNAKR